MQSRRERAETVCPTVNDVSQRPRVKNTIWNKPVGFYEHLHKKTSLYSLPSWLCCGSYSKQFSKKMTLFRASKQVKRPSASPPGSALLRGHKMTASLGESAKCKSLDFCPVRSTGKTA